MGFGTGSARASCSCRCRRSRTRVGAGRRRQSRGRQPWRGGSPLQALAELFGDDPWILILDNLEQVASAAGDLAELLGRCRGVAILATSRTVLGLAAERE